MSEHPDPSAVRAVPCLAELNDEEAAAVARRLRALRLAPGEVLFSHGHPGDSVYVLVSGEVDVRVPGHDGEHDLATLGPGTFLGEFALLADERRTRSVVGRIEAELWELGRDVFEAGLEAGEAWATRFLMAVARELARQMLAVDELLVALMDECKQHDLPAARVRELERLRRQLSGEWSFF